MDSKARVRWTVLLVALAATLLAAFAPGEAPIRAEVASVPRVSVIAASTPLSVAAGSGAPDVQQIALSVDVDPFSARGWQVPPPVVERAPPQPLQVATVDVAAPMIPAVPPLPFTYVGRFQDAGAEVVYLKQGDQTLLARKGETLQNTYTVAQLTAQQIEFLHIPTGEKQVLNLPSPEQ